MSLVACIYYAIASISLTLCNRALFKVFDFNFPATITAIQLVLSTIFLQIFKLTGALPVDSLQWKYVPKLAPLTLAWWIYVVSGVSALQYLNVSLYKYVRKLNPSLPCLSSIKPLMQLQMSKFLTGGSVCFQRNSQVYTFVVGLD